MDKSDPRKLRLELPQDGTPLESDYAANHAVQSVAAGKVIQQANVAARVDAGSSSQVVAAVPLAKSVKAAPVVEQQELPVGPSVVADKAPKSSRGNRDQRSLVRATPLRENIGTAVSQEEYGQELESIRQTSRRRRRLLTTAPSWLISLVFHLGLILLLAAITFDPVRSVISILEASMSSEDVAIEEFQLESPQLDTSDQLAETLDQPTESTEVVEMPVLTSPLMPTVEVNVEALDTNALTESIMPSSILDTSALAQMSSALNSRSTASKSEMIERFGGTAASEKAVALALKWLAAHQASDGGWNFNHTLVCRGDCKDAGDLNVARNGATAMALLPFLGAGQTHLDGEYKMTVKRGLAFLINRMKVTPSSSLPHGSWHEPGGRMYSHGLAAITICEAYAMTRDYDLQRPAQLSLNYLVYAQSDRDGGWRYGPKQPGDTSVVGWCLMALKSGKMGNLVVPDRTIRAANGFLDYVSTNDGAYYGYTKPTAKINGRQATTAVGLLCRMYLGYPKEHPGLAEGIKFLSKKGPREDDLYYTYYATQVLRHHGGPMWEKWNNKLRDNLVASQEKNGHAAGSWRPKGSHSSKGGRLYQTSLATMILEVYYRHMPLYSERSSADDFEI